MLKAKLNIGAYFCAMNGGYCVYYSSNLFCNTHSFDNWGIFLIIIQQIVTLPKYGHDALDIRHP